VHDEFTSLFKDLLLSEAGVSRLSSLKRSTPLYAQGDKAEAVYFIEDGLIKLTRTDSSGSRLILSVCGPNDLVGQESLYGGRSFYHAEAEVLSQSTVYRVPWAAIKRVIAAHPQLGAAFLSHLVDANLCFAQKVELHCLHDVQTRIMYYLEELAKLVKPAKDDVGYPLPITQLELADLVGATRETVSTSLNQLEKAGFVRLSRRLLTVFPRQSASVAVAQATA
jgi:CRP/FNR family transcriptional regulator